MKKWIFVLSLVLTFNAYAAHDGWKNCDDGGTANCEYQIKDGVLTIRPYDATQPAAIPDYERDCSITKSTECTTPAPWRWDEDTGTVTTLNIESGISSIGYDAFEDMPIQKAVLPEGLTSIGAMSFLECTALSEIDLPNTLETIAHFGLTNTALVTLELPDSLKTISAISFAYLSNFEDGGIVIPEGVTNLSEDAFVGYGDPHLFVPSIYCQADLMEQCAAAMAKVGGQAVEYVKNSDGSFSVGGETYLTVSDLQKGYACGNEETCAAIKEAYETGENIKIGDREYASIQDYLAGNALPLPEPEPEPEPEPVIIPEPSSEIPTTEAINSNFTAERGKRIYTVKEANEAAGKKNKVMIRYK